MSRVGLVSMDRAVGSRRRLRELWADESGTEAAEYALTVAMVVLPLFLVPVVCMAVVRHEWERISPFLLLPFP